MVKLYNVVIVYSDGRYHHIENMRGENKKQAIIASLNRIDDEEYNDITNVTVIEKKSDEWMD